MEPGVESYTFNDSQFEQNAGNMFKNLYREEYLTDVTIACEDGKLLKVHKIVLATRSDVMRHIFTSYSNPNTLLYFGDTSFENMQNMLEYIYCGEISIKKDQLNTFIETANRFKIKGLYTEMFSNKGNAILEENENFQKQKSEKEELGDVDQKFETVSIQSIPRHTNVSDVSTQQTPEKLENT